MFGKKKMWKNVVIGLVAFVIVFSVVSLCVVKYFMDNRFKRTVLSEYCFEIRYEDVKEQFLPLLVKEWQMLFLLKMI